MVNRCCRACRIYRASVCWFVLAEMVVFRVTLLGSLGYTAYQLLVNH